MIRRPQGNVRDYRQARMMPGRPVQLVAREGYSNYIGVGDATDFQLDDGSGGKKDLLSGGGGAAPDSSGGTVNPSLFGNVMGGGISSSTGGGSSSSAGSPGILSTIGSGFASAGGAILGVYNQGQRAQGAANILAAQQAQGGMPSWLLPVAIGGVGLVAVLLLTGPKKNPARRRRRR